MEDFDLGQFVIDFGLGLIGMAFMAACLLWA